ncbi:MAG: hypothetical protein HY347_04530 [candidate division NC10 bacterium]|nr:hypothetical protein [candidate division NC10 bacterium]
MDKEEIRKRVEEDTFLYERFAKPLEREHYGKFVAISREGELIIDSDQIHVLEEAIKRFGRGNFALRRFGFKALGRWKTKVAY